MKPFWLDEKFLQLTEQFAKRFNWLTGKDNFWLAQHLIFVGGLTFMIYLYLESCDILGMVLFSVAIIAVNTLIETIRDCKQTLSEVKNLECELGLLFLRMPFLFGSLMGAFFNLTSLFFPVKGSIIFLDVWVSFWAFSFYLISVERPPFSKSKILEWLREQTQLDSSTLKPIPLPIRTN